jgi:hypothetical protein
LWRFVVWQKQKGDRGGMFAEPVKSCELLPDDKTMTKGKKGKQQRGNNQDFAKSPYWDTVKENPGRKRRGVKVKTTVHADNELRVAVEAGS